MEFVSSCHSTVFSPEPIRYIKLNWSLFHSVSRSGNVKMWQWMELILSQSIKMSSNLESPSRCSYVSPCLTNCSHTTTTESKVKSSSSGDENRAWLSDWVRLDTRLTDSLSWWISQTIDFMPIGYVYSLLSYLLTDMSSSSLALHSHTPEELYQNMSILILVFSISTTDSNSTRKMCQQHQRREKSK